MNYGFVKTACATPTIRVADCVFNSEQIISQISFAAQHGASLVVFPELCVTGYTCGDMFLQNFLLEHAEHAIEHILTRTKAMGIMAIVGVPVAVNDSLYNCAAVIYKGELLALVPKCTLPNYNEYCELRYFTSGKDVDKTIHYAGQDVLLSHNVVLSCNQLKELRVAVELCEDLMAPVSPAQRLVLDGNATVIANPAASNEYAGKSDYRRDLVRVNSGKLCCAYLFSSAGPGESSTDAVYSAHSIIAENANILGESVKYAEGITYADIDVQRLMTERRKNNNFASVSNDSDIHYINFDMPIKQTKLSRNFRKHPFIPSEKSELAKRCEEILTMQAVGLSTRMKSASIRELVLGVSGGLDSTLALIVSVKALDILGLSRKNLHAISMPCFGTTVRTKSNAEKLSLAYGADFSQVDITKAVKQHFEDIGQDEHSLDTTYENAQARQRTMVLMDVANKLGALVVGTGDLSELALGWATYNGDHMSMYGVNGSIPKTLVRHVVRHVADTTDNFKLSETLLDILDTPVSPELLPAKDGEIAQKTEDLVGPYELHDFFLYHAVRWACPPKKIYYLAQKAFTGQYDNETILHWLRTFFRRFFNQQFKRSCLPDGPKVGSVGLSPRGDWNMPSDAMSTLWLAEIDELKA